MPQFKLRDPIVLLVYAEEKSGRVKIYDNKELVHGTKTSSK
jgi:hypothetical protein